jgi:hypothetical protein
MNHRGWIGSSVLLATVAAVGVGLAAWKYSSIQESNAASARQSEPMESVTVAVASEREHRHTTTSIDRDGPRAPLGHTDLLQFRGCFDPFYSVGVREDRKM